MVALCFRDQKKTIHLRNLFKNLYHYLCYTEQKLQKFPETAPRRCSKEYLFRKKLLSLQKTSCVGAFFRRGDVFHKSMENEVLNHIPFSPIKTLMKM